ncbi:unnamed protein product [Closterium sp. Naga37s-1]|nr:unnamed protein product [Closterium sp. Naga37s-1]
MAPKATRSFRGLLSQRSHMAKALPRRGLRPAKEVEERMASAGISSMGNGKAVRALLLTFPAMPPSQTTRVVVPWKQASMTGKAVCRAIRFFQGPECKGQTLDVFANGRQRCAFHSCSPCFHARMLLMPLVSLHHLTNDCLTRGAPPPPVWSEKYISEKARSALCLIEDLCQYASCPAGSNTCTPPTDDSAAVTCACKKGYSAVNNKCLPSKASCVTTGCPANAKCARRTGGTEMECKCKAGYNAVGGTCVPAAKSGTTTTPSGTTTTPSGTTSAPSGTSTATIYLPGSLRGGHLTSLRKERRTHSQRADDFVSVTRQSSLEAVKEGALRKQRLRVSVCGDRHTARCLCALEMDKSSNRVLPQARIVGASC